MTDDDRTRFATLMEAFGHAHRAPVTAETAELYFRLLRDLPIDALEATLAPWSRTHAFFPAVSDLRTLVEGSREDAAELAWLDLLREVRRVGYMRTPSLPEATLDTISGLWGSWRHLCETLPGEGPGFTAMAKQFKAAYGATRARAEQGQLSRGEASTILRGLLQDATREGPRRLVGAKR
jgi:hypothetical protein